MNLFDSRNTDTSDSGKRSQENNLANNWLCFSAPANPSGAGDESTSNDTSDQTHGSEEEVKPEQEQLEGADSQTTEQSAEADSEDKSVENDSDPGNETDAPSMGGVKSKPTMFRRMWVAALVLVTAWFVNYTLRRDKESDDQPATPDTVAIVKPNEEFYARFNKDGDLSKAAYQFVDQGLVSYNFPFKHNELASVKVSGIPAGSENEAFFEKLDQLEIKVKDGDDWLARQKVEAEKELIDSKNRSSAYRLFEKVLGIGAFIGLFIYAVGRIASALKEKSMLSLPGMKKSVSAVLKDKPTEGFDHVGGISPVIHDLEQLVEDIKQVIKGDQRVNLPQGILFHGPPGTGKTMLARAIAAETSCGYLAFKGSELCTEFFIGSGVAKVSEAFSTGRSNRDALQEELRAQGNPNGQGVQIIFIDEVDSILRRRPIGAMGGNDEEVKVTNAVLAELDNVDKGLNKNILVIAATNNYEGLDPAAIRPGRFDRHIEVPKPMSKIGRLDILQKAAKFKFEKSGYSFKNKDYSLERLARMTPGESGADLVGMMEKARDIARRSDRTEITFEDLMEGFQQQKFGFKADNVVDDIEREKTCWHEGPGHALTAWLLGVDTFLISSTPRGKTLGRVLLDPEAMSEVAPTKKDLLSNLLITVAGNAAEEFKFGDLGQTIGNTGDIEQARRNLYTLISTGLLGKNVANSLIGPTRDGKQELTDDQAQLINDAVEHAKVTVLELLNSFPKGVLDTFVSKYLELKDELVGDNALKFVGSVLNGCESEVREKAQEILKEYYADPLGMQSRKDSQA